MSAVVVISITGEEGLWVADLRAGTVTPLDPPAGSKLKEVADLRKSGTSITKDVNFAVVVKSAKEAASGHYEG
ncbi:MULTISPECIES: hypothetical protein [unclassified Rhizobium]|jgi:hypothetical protein|uniref:hypothetical protein n=1 Tax=unclassified Rhizobium TaxID=2613769 RepID=UPI00037F14E2|nr:MULTISPECIES: hypothetical protein [unclassified Rhizobium]MBO9127183.1 hypothetical protein [Rhizobium sp. 16-488-2b]MBO9177630.1 hypothetical protein [Rhizobium sp. 16-488-2a]MBO9195087.1 hypothetical protein [Rhizobium sp. 16-449-1b]